MSPKLRSPLHCPGAITSAAGLSRRQFLQRAGHGFGGVALAQMLAADQPVPSGAARFQPHFRPRAKRCIFLFMVGGPSQMDLFDPKPVLDRLHGQPLPPSFGRINSQFLESDPLCLRTTRRWGRYGQSGMDLSDLIPGMRTRTPSPRCAPASWTV